MISVVMLCKDNQRYIKKTLHAISKFNEVILIDTGSSDKTLEIAKSFSNVSIHKKPFNGFGSLRNIGSEIAKNDWILTLDTDEVISFELANEILNLTLNDKSIYEIPFKNFYNRKWIKGCGWYPEAHIRLYNKKKTSFTLFKVHEKVLKEDLNVVKLKNYIYHTSYHTISDFIEKMQRYSSLFAIQNAGKKKSSFKKALIHGFFAFFKSYFLKRGFLMGKEGFVISSYNANTAFYKYMKLLELNQKK